jgi:hypothetical protein
MRCPEQDTEKMRFIGVGEGCGYWSYDCDVESQSGDGVHVVTMSIPVCLAWHVLSFLLGIVTTVVVIGVVSGREGGGVWFLLRPWG